MESLICNRGCGSTHAYACPGYGSVGDVCGTLLCRGRLEKRTPVGEACNLAIPSDSAERKTLPVATGVLDYFPAALAEIAKLSKIGNDKHNPGEPLHWSRGKSSDHADCILRHLIDRGQPDPGSGGLSHTVAVAWRALALLQEELERAGAPMARGAR